MKFKSYGEISNSYISEATEKIRNSGFSDSRYIYGCYRKIDGCNFQISVDENENIITGSRNRIVSPDENFSGCERVIERYGIKEKLQVMKQKISESEDIRIRNFFSHGYAKFILTVFGELCGGLYRHPDVKKVQESQRIQGRIDYSPDNEWIVFDAFISDPEYSETVYFDMDFLKNVCAEINLPCQIEEFRGTFEECIRFSPEFNDNTGSIFWNLPEIKGNTAEGVVIKPVIPLFFENGERVILKNKNPKYKERIRATKAVNKESGTNLKEEEKKWLAVLSEYMNKNRVLSAVSKIGKITVKSFKDLQEISAKDAFEDFKKENPEFMKKSNGSDPKEFSPEKIYKVFHNNSADAVREIFLELIR